MMIIGCDFHPRFQQIVFLDQVTGEYGERRLQHRGDAPGRSFADEAEEPAGRPRPIISVTKPSSVAL
jgi:hypothetical protein